jgi:regulator of protease activity HflC (stomatin/prohibitin superfamily)
METKKIFYCLGIFSTFLVLFLACSRVSADINEEVVFDKHPIFGKGGIDMIPLEQGSCVVSLYTKTYKFVMTPVQHEENFSNLSTSDQTFVNLNAFLTLKLQKRKTPLLLRGWGMNWYENNVQEAFREMVRTKLCAFPMLDLVANRQIYDEIKEDLRKQIEEYIVKTGLPIEVTALVISKVEPPEEIRNELNTLSQEKAKEKTQKQRLKTEEARLATERARAKADQAYMKEMGFTPAQYIEYLRAKALENRSDIIRFENVK